MLATKPMIRNLVFLNIAEMFERMTYYGVRAILILYMTQAVDWDKLEAINYYGYFTLAIYIVSIAAGIIADTSRKPALLAIIGNTCSTIGVFALALSRNPVSVTCALALIAIGTGTYKPAIIGALYRACYANKPRFDLVYMTFYMVINIGAFLAPIIIGGFSQAGTPNAFRLGFLVAGGLSLIPTLTLLFNYKNLLINDLLYDNERYRLNDASITKIIVCFLVSIVFWMAYALFPIYTNGMSSNYQIIGAVVGLIFFGICIPLHLIPNFRSAIKMTIGLMLAALVCFMITVLGVDPIIGIIVFAAAEVILVPLLLSQIILGASPRITCTLSALFMAVAAITNKFTDVLSRVEHSEQPMVM